jgi:hypothetical protein
MPSPSPFTSAEPQHVIELSLTSLTMTMPSLDRTSVSTAQDWHAQTRPKNAHARQDAHGDAPERDRTPPCPVDTALPSLSPGACTLTSMSASDWTTPLGHARPVAFITDDDHPPPYCHGAMTLTTRPFLPLPRHDARQHCLDVANAQQPSLAPSLPWNDDLVDDLLRTLGRPSPL